MFNAFKVSLSSFNLPIFLLLTALSLPAHAGWFDWLFKDTYTQTRHPIVLGHGLIGFDDIAGFEYWYRIPEELRRSGADVYVTQVSAVNSTELRGEQLARQVENILAATGAQKVNLIGHSHGGPTVRYVASVYPDYVASVTNIAGPVTGGARLADVLEGLVEDLPLTTDVIATVLNAAFDLLDLISTGGFDQDAKAALASVSTKGIAEFAERHPQGVPDQYCGQGNEIASNGVRYYSWSGAKPLTNPLDITDPLLGLISLVYQGETNDAVVSSCASHLGMVIRDNYRMNHFDEINQVAGIVSPFETSPIAVFRQHANRLKNRGL